MCVGGGSTMIELSELSIAALGLTAISEDAIIMTFHKSLCKVLHDAVNLLGLTGQVEAP